MIDVLGPEKRRRRTTQEKIAIVQQSFEPGMTVSLVARQHGVAASQLFLWRKQYLFSISKLPFNLTMLVNFVITSWQQLSFFYRIVQSSYEIIKFLYQEVKNVLYIYKGKAPYIS